MMHGKTFDLTVDYAYRHIPERDWQWRHIPLRLIAVWNPLADAHRLYLTSASNKQLDSDNAAAVYALRWEIELLFRELKGQLRIAEMPSGKKAAVETLLYASVLALALGRKLLAVLGAKQPVRQRRELPKERWSALMRAAMPALLDLILSPPRMRQWLERRLATLFAREAPDPNRNRMLLPRRAEFGLVNAAASQC